MRRIAKSFAFFLTLAFVLSLCACGNREPAQSGTMELPETPVADPAEAVSMDESSHAEMMAAYKLALQDFAFNHILPDGTSFEMSPDFGCMEENSFAIYDVDSDGAEELLIRFGTAPMAGMFEGVYHYVDGAVTEQMVAFPGSTYYLNNIVLCRWSHNQTSGPADFWPYSVCAYRAESDTFDFVAHVEGWDKTVSEVDSSGNAFPAEKDDGSGVVYLVTTVGEAEPAVYSQTEFQLWEQLTFGGSVAHFDPSQSAHEESGATAVFHTIPWQDMTEANINAL